VTREMRETSYQFTTHDSQQPKAFRGGERKVMKKSLSLLLAFALVFSMFSSLAFAADSTSVADKLVNAGIIKGTKSGDLKENETWKRQDVTVIIARLLGKEAEAQNTAKNHSFADVKDLYYDGFITYAYENGYFTGHSDIRFGYGEDITVKQFVAVMLRVLGYDVEWDEVEEVAVEVGLVPANTDFNKAATRGEYFVIIDSTLQTEVAEGGVTLGEQLGLEGYVDEEDEAEQAIASFKAVGAKKLEVKFAAAVDTSKATFAVKKGTVPVNIASTSFSDDKLTATLTLSAPMTKGEYTVSVSGVSEEALTASVSVEDEKVTSITFDSNKAPLDRNDQSIVYVTLKVWNQYGEDVTSAKQGQVNVTAPYGDVSFVANAPGKVKIDSTTNFFLDQQITVAALYTGDGGVFKSEVFTVSAPARISEITATKVWNANNKTLDASIDLSQEAFYVLLDAKDQYGNSVVNATEAKLDLMVSVINNSVVDVRQSSTTVNPFEVVNVDGVNTLAVRLINPGSSSTAVAGTATVYAVSNTNGARATIDVVVKQVSTLDTLSLSSPELAVASDSKVIIPFSAVDQFGEEIKSAATLNAALNAGTASSKFNVSGPNGLDKEDIYFTQDYVNNTVSLELDLSGIARGTVTTPSTVIISAVTPTGKFASLTFTLQPDAKPLVVTGVKNIKTALALNASTTIENANVQVVDQYSRTKALSDFVGQGYSAQITSSNTTAVSVSNATLDNTTTSSTLSAGASAGSSTITIVLKDTNGEIAGSAYNLNIRVVDKSAITGYKVADVPLLYASTNASTNYQYAETLSVSGLLSDGTEVALPAYASQNWYVVNATNFIAFNTVTGEVYATTAAKDDVGNNAEKTYNLIITGDTNSDGVVVEVPVKVSTVAPKVTTIALKDTAGSFLSKNKDKVAVGTAANINRKTALQLANDILVATDQYGESIALGLTSAIATGFSGGGSVNATGQITGVAEGNSFKIIAVNANAGVTFDFTVVVNG